MIARCSSYKMEETIKEKQEEAPPITLKELQLKIYHPPPSNFRFVEGSGTCITRNINGSSGNDAVSKSLSSIPWTLRQSANDGASIASGGSSLSFPTTSYLDLRRQQNRAWADDRLSKGNEQFYLDPVKADSLYQEGIDLVSDHVELLVAQAKLWMQRRSRPQAAKAQLQECLHLDPNHVVAKDLLRRLEQQDASRRGVLVAPNKRLPQTLESSSAFQDVLMERNLAMDTSLVDTEKELDEESSAASSERKDSRKKKKKKKRKSKKKSKHRHNMKHEKKRRRKRKRYDYSSSSTEDDASSNSSEESDAESSGDSDRRDGSTDRRRERRRKHKRKRPRRRRHDSDLSGSDSVVEVEPTLSPSIQDGQRNGGVQVEGGLDPNGFEDSSMKHNRQEASHLKSNKHKKRRRKDSHDELSSSEHEPSTRNDNRDDEKISP